MTEADAAGKKNVNAVQGRKALEIALWGGGILVFATLAAYESYELYRLVVWLAS